MVPPLLCCILCLDRNVCVRRGSNEPVCGMMTHKYYTNLNTNNRYAFHRFFHLKFIYRHFHKLHHRFQPPTSYSAVAFHPVEFTFYVLGGQVIFFFVPIHPIVMLTVGGYTAYYLIEDHTGIKVTSCFPWQPSSMYHDDHHRYFHCNFGQHVLWFDWVFGTLRATKREYGENCFGGKGSYNKNKKKAA